MAAVCTNDFTMA